MKRPGNMLVPILLALLLIGCEAVSPAPPAPASLALTGQPPYLLVGQSHALTAVLQPVGSVAQVQFTSSDTQVATVDAQGMLTAIGAGQAQITAATAEGLQDRFTLTVRPAGVVSMAFLKPALELTAGEDYTVEPVVETYEQTPYTIAYASGDERIAAIDASGLIHAVSPGEVDITATLHGEGLEKTQAVLCVTVRAPGVASLTLSAPFVSLLPGGEFQLTCSLTPQGADGEVVWTSTDTGVVTVDAKGALRGIGIGTATVTAASGDKRASCTVSVASRKPLDPLADIPAPRFSNHGGILRNNASSDTGEASIMLVGDLMCLASQQRAAQKGNTYDFNKSFQLVRMLFAQSDFTMGNLETLISHSSPYTIEEKSIGGLPHCNGPATYLDAVRYAGFDAVATANNHCCDAGTAGIHETLAMLDRYGLPSCGVYRDPDAPRYILADINGIRVAFLSYTEIFNGKQVKLTGDQQDAMLSAFSQARVARDTAAARANGAEYIIAYMHWGLENTHEVLREQQQCAQQMADAGVDFIAGSHPHCLQKAQTLTASDGRQVLCVYSMGNFVSSMVRDINNDTLIVRLQLKRESGRVTVADAGYIACKVFHEHELGSHVVIPVEQALNGGRTGGALDEARTRIRQVMGTVLREIIQ